MRLPHRESPGAALPRPLEDTWKRAQRRIGVTNGLILAFAVGAALSASVALAAVIAPQLSGHGSVSSFMIATAASPRPTIAAAAPPIARETTTLAPKGGDAGISAPVTAPVVERQDAPSAPPSPSTSPPPAKATERPEQPPAGEPATAAQSQAPPSQSGSEQGAIEAQRAAEELRRLKRDAEAELALLSTERSEAEAALARLAAERARVEAERRSAAAERERIEAERTQIAAVLRASEEARKLAQEERTKTASETVPAASANACRAEIVKQSRQLVVYFGSGTSDIPAPSVEPILALARSVNACPDVKVEVGGHTDPLGTEGNNFQLSWMRAEAVIRLLKSNNVPWDRFDPVGYGVRRLKVAVREPVDTSDPEQVPTKRPPQDLTKAHAPNRRVEFLVR